MRHTFVARLEPGNSMSDICLSRQTLRRVEAVSRNRGPAWDFSQLGVILHTAGVARSFRATAFGHGGSPPKKEMEREGMLER